MRDKKGSYIHHGTIKFDTGITLKMLHEYHIIALDEFKLNAYHKDTNELAGWLSLLITENIDDVDYVIKEFPWLQEIYEEIATYRGNIQGVISMYSQMLRETDQSNMRYMIDVYKEQIDAQQAEIAEKDEQIASKDEQITQLLAEIETLRG